MDQFYEGREKVLRVKFRIVEDRSLVDIDKNVWENVLKEAGCKIISAIHAGKARVYLLSESSLFIWTNHMILKTCGYTTPLKIIPLLFKQISWLKGVDKLSYSHGSFLKPRLQALGYRCPDETSALLSETLANTPAGPGLGPGKLHVFSDNSFQYSTVSAGNIPSVVVDIRMSKLRSSGLYFWTQDRRFINKVFDKFFGMDQSVGKAGWVIDGHHFDPCGFSLNAINNFGLYATVHVTPEENFSYASYETNDLTDISGRLFRLMEIFSPEELTILYSSERVEYQIGEIIHETLTDYSFYEESYKSVHESTVQYKCVLRDTI